VVQLALRGTLTVTERAALADCLDRYCRLFAGLEGWERHTDLVVMPSDQEFDDLDIGGFAADALAELLDAARAEGAAGADARAALGLLLRLRQGEVA